MFEWIIIVYEYLSGPFMLFLSETTDVLFAGNYIYLSMVIVSIVSVFTSRRDNSRTSNLLVAFTLVTLLLFVYNPLFSYIFHLFPYGFDDVKARIFLLCPFWLIIASDLSETALRFRRKVCSPIFAIVIAFILIFAGDSIDSRSMANDSECIYKIKDQSVDIAEEALQISNNEPVSLFIVFPNGSNGKFENGGSVYEGIKQYSAIISVDQYAFTEEAWNERFLEDTMPDGVTLTEEYIRTFLSVQTSGYDLIAFPDDERINNKICNSGYVIVGQASGYNLYSLIEQ